MTSLIDRKNYLKIAAFLTGCFFIWGCENDPKTIEQWTRNDVMVEEAHDIETYLSQNGKLKAKLWSVYMLRYEADTVYVEFPRQLHVDFFDSTAQKESHLDALYGKYYESLNKVYLRDSVVVFNVTGDTLQTPELWWDQNTQKFFTDKPVRIRKSGHMIMGVGMDARQDLTDIHITRITNSILQVPDSLGVE
jgi:LPS export ABC transporter protein LptC